MLYNAGNDAIELTNIEEALFILILENTGIIVSVETIKELIWCRGGFYYLLNVAFFDLEKGDLYFIIIPATCSEGFAY